MSDIFGGVEPPAWLSHLAKPADMGVASKVIGEMVGGLAKSAEIAMTTAKTKQEEGVDTNWIKELPGSIQPGLTEARLNMQNPLWKQQLQVAQMNMAHQYSTIQDNQSLIDARRQKMVMEARDKEVITQFFIDHPTVESRKGVTWPIGLTPEGNRTLRDHQLADNSSDQHAAELEGIKGWSKGIQELQKISAEKAGPFIPLMSQLPTAAQQAAFSKASAEAQKEKLERETSTEGKLRRADGTWADGYFTKGVFHEFSKTTPVNEKSVAGSIKKPDGTEVFGYFTKGAFHPFPNPPTPPNPIVHLPPDLKDRLTGAREQANAALAAYNTALASNMTDTTKVEGNMYAANRRYELIVREAKQWQDEHAAAAPAAPGAPAAAPTAGKKMIWNPDAESLTPKKSD